MKSCIAVDFNASALAGIFTIEISRSSCCLYSIPGKKETQGKTEQFIGSWLTDQKRENLVIATKVTGPFEYFNYIRENLGFSREVIYDALNKSLSRLQTDYVDIYQLHWPERNTNFFGKRNYTHDKNDKWESYL